MCQYGFDSSIQNDKSINLINSEPKVNLIKTKYNNESKLNTSTKFNNNLKDLKTSMIKNNKDRNTNLN